MFGNFANNAELAAHERAVAVQLAQAEQDVAGMDARSLGQMGPCTPPVRTGLGGEYHKSVRKQLKRDADRTDRVSNRESRRMAPTEERAEKADVPQGVKARPLTEAGKKLLPPHRHLRLDITANRPVVDSNHPIVEHMFAHDGAERRLRVYPGLDTSQQSRDAFIRSTNESLARLWGNAASAVPFNYYAPTATVLQLAFPFYFNTALDPCCCGLIEVDPAELDKNNPLRLPNYRVQKTVLTLAQANYNVRGWKPVGEWPDSWDWLRTRP